MELGIIFAVVAMLSWGIGDVLIQKTTRTIGNWESLFIISTFGVIVILPFVAGKSWTLFTTAGSALPALLLAGLILFFAALLDFEALREGKLAVVEPIWSLEIPVSALLAYILLREHLSILQIVTIAFLIVGLAFVSFRGGKIKAKHFLEKGALIAVLAACFMGTANFFMGLSGRFTDSLVTNFITSLIIMVLTGIYLLYRGRIGKLFKDIRQHKKLLFTMSFFDNLAWVAFVAAMALAPIGIVVALSESYIIIVVLIGIFINKEKIVKHQKFGLVIAVASAILLATISL